MLCQKCGKNEADVHFVQTINGDKLDVMLCSVCAGYGGISLSPLSFVNFFQSFINDYEASKFLRPDTHIACINCSITLDELVKYGKAGCAECYDEFKHQMQAIIKNVQAGEVHTGKCHKNAWKVLNKRQINSLRQKLLEAVEAEEFEEAARLRDSIREMERGSNGQMV